MLVDTMRLDDLDAVMLAMQEGDAHHRYSVAWIDLLATGRHLGRGVLTAGDHAPRAALPVESDDVLAFDPTARLATPPWVPSGLLNKLSIRAFNELWFRKAPRRRRDELQSIGAFFHPLDGVRDWNRLYGAGGFLQHQSVVPFGEEATLRALVERLARAGAPAFLAVLKRFGAASPASLSFPIPGWTLALDISAAVDGLPELLDDLDRMVVDVGGRVYLAKDSRLDPRHLTRMYPRVGEWQAVRDRLDPTCRWQSDLARRLGLCGHQEEHS
jgi:decaprenylphospho-beta-D-ribofuranose 2-oxidase